MVRAFFFWLPMLCWMVLPVHALDAPKGRILLTVSGDISVANADGAAHFDRGMLEALDWQEIESHTFYTEGLQRFSGPSLSALLDLLGVQSGVLYATALDDYTIEIPVSDAATYGVLVALDQNGAPMRVRDRGPIWLIYPVSGEAEITDIHQSRMIWQLRSIVVRR